jgi:type IX secretion system PorP/SprF family membrane protein
MLVIFLGELDAQEIHFSQFNNNQLLINPAYAGHFDGNVRLGASYRSQGASISIPYTTYSGWGDVHVEPKWLNNSSIGLGLCVYNDNAGEGSLQTTSGYFSASLTKGFNRDNSIRATLGFSVGFINRSVDISKLVFDNQWNGTIFDPGIASGEPSGNSLFVPDINVGTIFCWDINDKLHTNVGAAMHHVNRPNLSFYDAENKLDYKFIINGMVKARINDMIQLNPGIYFSNQVDVNEVIIGSNLLFIKEDFRFLTGLWYRLERDIIPHLGLIYHDFILEFSYDINISKLHIASNYRGGIEISLVKTFSYQKNHMGCNEF